MDSTSLQQSIQRNLFRFGGPILMMIGSVSCILSFIVFTKKNLRKSPCAVYFAALSVADFLFIYLSLFTSTLLYGYNIDTSTYNTALCHLIMYLSFLLDSFSSSYLVFASIDRILVTSSNVQTRRYSTRRLAILCIISASLFWAVFHIHAIVLTSIQQFGPNYFVCYFQSSMYAAFVGYYSVLKSVLIPLIMITCAVWSVKNLRGLHKVRVAPISMATRTTAANNQHSTSSKDRQLVLMLLIDIALFIVFNFMMSAILMEVQITQYETKAYERILFENFLRNVASFCINIPCSVGLYTKLLVSKTFRSEVKKVFTSIGHFRSH